jgi:hypothetical protein
VGNGGTILHFDGVHWQKMTNAVDVQLNGIWGSSATDVFAVGNGGVILHYDGTRWRTLENGTLGPGYSYLAVWGSSADEVFVVGGLGVILHGVRIEPI